MRADIERDDQRPSNSRRPEETPEARANGEALERMRSAAAVSTPESRANEAALERMRAATPLETAPKPERGYQPSLSPSIGH
jgi:hypothetical protein